MATLALKPTPVAGAGGAGFTSQIAPASMIRAKLPNKLVAQKPNRVSLSILNVCSQRPYGDAVASSHCPSQFAAFSIGLAAAFCLTCIEVPAAIAGPLSDLLPDSAPPAPIEKFERDLGEGRKVRVKDAEPPKDTEVGRLPAPLPYAKARRAGIETEIDPGTPPGISREKPESSVAAPLSYSTPRPQS